MATGKAVCVAVADRMGADAGDKALKAIVTEEVAAWLAAMEAPDDKDVAGENTGESDVGAEAGFVTPEDADDDDDIDICGGAPPAAVAAHGQDDDHCGHRADDDTDLDIGTLPGLQTPTAAVAAAAADNDGGSAGNAADGAAEPAQGANADLHALEPDDGADDDAGAGGHHGDGDGHEGAAGGSPAQYSSRTDSEMGAADVFTPGPDGGGKHMHSGRDAQADSASLAEEAVESDADLSI